ncbi:MAG: RluA family pseudouridine synthase [Clostridia bacterium]|nr:RluA family pseudouridine synthase [Clostridia bacterium]
MRTVTVGANDAGQRLDKFLTKFLKTCPQSMIYKCLRKKRIKLNGKKAEGNVKLAEGDVLDMYINDEFFGEVVSDTSFIKVKPDLNIIYEDENIMLIDKKVGMIVHEDDSEKFNTLISHIKAYLYQKGEYNPQDEQSFAPALCNRIDRNTGGIVIAAKNAAALRAINEKIKSREIKKYYLCMVQGHVKPESGTLVAYLQKNESQNRVYLSDTPKDGYKKCVTKYKTVGATALASYLEIDLITGRTHQIRAQMAHIGHPLAGDGKYGTNEFNKKVGLKYQALYSYKTEFAFTDDNILSYLNGKSFEVDKQNIPWYKK